MATIEQLLPGGSGAPAYTLALRDSQYLVYHVGGALLTRVLGDAVEANRALLVLVAIAWPLAVRSLLRSLGRDDRGAVFAPMVFWNRALLVGFLPFVASLPLAVFTVAVSIRQARGSTHADPPEAGRTKTHADPPEAGRTKTHADPPEAGRTKTYARGAFLALLSFVLFYTHLSAWLAASAISGAIALASCFTERDDQGRRSWRPLVAVAPTLVPSAIAAIVWWSAASLAIKGQESTDVDRSRLIDALNLMPPWTFDVWTGHLDEAAACGWWLAYAIMAAAGLREKPEARGRWVVATLPFAIAAVIYLATPFRVGAAGLLNVRLAPLVTLFALVALRPRNDRVGTIALGLVSAATLFEAGSNVFEMRRVARENIGEIDALVSTMKHGSRVAILNFAGGPRRMFEWPYPFAGSLHRTRGGGIVAFSFVEVPHWSVHYAHGEGPPARPFLWVYNPCAYRFEDGRYYDYVLVQGAVEPWPPRTPGPPFAPVAHAGVFTLFAKVEGPALDVEDRSPCLPPPQSSDGGADATSDAGAP
ncbi:MAG: hypothetical protein JST00_48150 [Deltaproteobacteria bacterium]|nr:hypothetical protein [Deltaproteobacteria bacterium]